MVDRADTSAKKRDMLSTFDHVTIAVADLEQAVRSYELLLGRPASERCRHPELGSDAALFGLRNAAIELVAPSAAAAEAEGLRTLLEARGEGLSALALGTSDASLLSTTLRARGVRATAPQPGEAHTVNGGLRAYRTVELSERTTRGLRLFAVERAELSQLRSEQPVASSAIDALDHVVIRSASLDAALTLYRDLLGLRLALDRTIAGVRMLFFRIGGVTLELVEDATLGEHDVLHGLAYRVRDGALAHARMLEAGLDVSPLRAGRKPGTQVFGVRGQSAGVPTLIIRDPARD